MLKIYNTYALHKKLSSKKICSISFIREIIEKYPV